MVTNYVLKDRFDHIVSRIPDLLPALSPLRLPLRPGRRSRPVKIVDNFLIFVGNI